MSTIRTTWSKAYADNFDDIFCKKDAGPSCTGFKTPGTYDPALGDALGVPHTAYCKTLGKIHEGECPPPPDAQSQPGSNIRFRGVCDCEVYEHCAACDPIAFPLDDGFGNKWSRQCPTCHAFTMEIVRPGQVQCTNCG
jgi:hypothetical protein